LGNRTRTMEAPEDKATSTPMKILTDAAGQAKMKKRTRKRGMRRKTSEKRER